MFGWQCVSAGVKTILRTIAYPFEISMNHITGMEVVEAFSDIG